MIEVKLEQLLEAGIHFGHQINRWNPKMEPFIFGKKNGVYIIDLKKTLSCLQIALDFIHSTAEKGEYILFVGTKSQAGEIVVAQSSRCDMFYVNTRWIGGTLTNFTTVRKSILRLEELRKMKENGGFNGFSKKEISHFSKELARLEKYLSGIVKMDKLPGALFVIDSKKEHLAVKEANKVNIPIVALIDTNSDPDEVTYPIPGNDDAIKSISLITSLVTEAIIEGRKKLVKGEEEEEKEKESTVNKPTIE